MDVPMEKEAVVLSPGEKDAATDAESEMKNDVTTVLGDEEQQQQQQHDGKEEEVMLPTRGTAENWKMLVNKAMKLTHVEKSFRAFYDMVVGVAFVKENCSEHLKKLALSFADDDTSGSYAFMPIQYYIFEVSQRVMAVHVQLLNLSRLDRQADEASNSHSSSATRSHSEISSDSEYKEDLKVLPQRLDSGGYGEIEHKEELTSFDICCPLIGDFDELQERHQITLQEFSGCLENCFKHGSIFDNMSKPDEKKYKEDLCTLESLLPGEKNNSSHDHPLLIPGPLVAMYNRTCLWFYRCLDPPLTRSKAMNYHHHLKKDHHLMIKQWYKKIASFRVHKQDQRILLLTNRLLQTTDSFLCSVMMIQSKYHLSVLLARFSAISVNKWTLLLILQASGLMLVQQVSF